MSATTKIDAAAEAAVPVAKPGRQYVVKRSRSGSTGERRQIGFNRSQQGIYRPLVEAAWVEKCGPMGWDAKDAESRDAWVRSELFYATGKRSTKDCTAGRDFERACARFEELAGSDFYWQTRAENGDEDRVRFWLKKECPGYLQSKFGGNRSLRTYLLEIAGSVVGRPIGQLRHLTDAEMDGVRNAMLIAGRRWLKERDEN